MIIAICVLLYLLIGAITAVSMVFILGYDRGEEVEIGLVTLFWPIAIVLDCLVSLSTKAIRGLGQIGRQIQKWSEPLITRLRNRNA